MRNICAIQCIHNSNRSKNGVLKFSNYKEEGSRIAIFFSLLKRRKVKTQEFPYTLLEGLIEGL